jgi:hypothetical protein
MSAPVRGGDAQRRNLRASLAAGVLAGVAGLLVFLAVHHLWIMPIWFILAPGLVVAALGGSAIGWAYAEVRAGLPSRPWTHLAFLLLVGMTLAPAMILAELRPALFDAGTGDLAPGSSVSRVAGHFVGELLLSATIVGGLAGVRLGKTKRAAFATALAGFAFALGPGHNIPLLAGTPGAGKGAILLIAVIAISTIVLVESESRLSRDRGAPVRPGH